MSTSILIAEDNLDTCHILQEYFTLQEEMYVCAVVHDGDETISSIDKYEPDVLILDIIMPINDGISVLEYLKNDYSGKRPVVILTSAGSQDFITRNASALGADYFLLKPYTLDVLKSRIKMLLKDKESHIMKTGKDKDISRFVIAIGVPTHILAYEYITRALEILITKTAPCAIGKNVYAVIAAEYNTNVECVERAIRQCVADIAALSTDTYKLVESFGNRNRDKQLTSSQLLKLAAECLKLQDITY